MNIRHIVSIGVLAIALFGCQHPVKPTPSSSVFIGPTLASEKPWTEKGFLNDPDNFQFAIIADLHGGYRPGVFEKAAKKINLMQPEFVLSVGDLIAGYTEDIELIGDQWREFERLIDPLGMRLFLVPGNHDLTNLTMTREWEKRFGETFYHFIYRNVLFLCLNSEDPPDTHISDEQIAYATKVLTENPDVRWTFTFMHKPLWLEKETGWEKIEAILAGRPHTVLAGHHHTYTKYRRHGQSYIRLATTGGGSQLSGAANGQFDHITWVTVTDRGPVIANLALDGILDEDIVTEESMLLVENLLSGKWLDVGGIVAETDSFTSGTLRIALSNTGSIPLKVWGAFKPHEQLKLSKRGIGVTVAPGETEDVAVDIRATVPVMLSDLSPLELKLSGIYNAPGRLPIVSEGTHQIDFRQSDQGPEMIRNGSFSLGLEGWQTATKAHDSGTASIESGAFQAEVTTPDPIWSMVAYQPIGPLKAGIDYQFSYRARSAHRSGSISTVFKNGSAAASDNAPILVNQQVQAGFLVSPDATMTPHTLDFRIAGDTDLTSAILMFVFSRADEVVIDDVSLRAIGLKQ